MWVYGLDWAGPGYRQVADACECGNEPSVINKIIIVASEGCLYYSNAHSSYVFPLVMMANSLKAA